MMPLLLEGENLGEKHWHYNKLLASATFDATFVLEKICDEDDDINNLFKIDVACARRDVQYVLGVLKGGDMLYVSRALRRSTWLLCDDQYAHIINPYYLHQQLFPNMTNKTKNKLLLAIRLNMKNPDRVEEFFKYYEDDIAIAQKFLPHCSLSFIENVVQKYADELSITLLTRLCKKSISILKKYCENTTNYDRMYVLKETKFLCSRNPNEYIDILDSLDLYLIPKFGVKITKSVMKSCRERLIDNYQRYYIFIHDSTFAKYLGRENIMDFLRMLSHGPKYMWSWSRYEHLSHFFRYLPHEKRFQYAKKLFIDKEPLLNDTDAEKDCPDKITLVFSSLHSADFYYWYRLAPFEIAFTELKERILIESKPAVRNKILLVLLHCAHRNPEHVHTLLTYYRNQHINEAFKFKIQFINKLLSRVHTHKLDETTWSILDYIYKSMDVYIETEKRAPFCVRSVIVYNVIRDQDVPDIIEKKFIFNTLRDYRKKLDEFEQNKLFSYLFSYIKNKIGSQSVTKESEMIIMIDLLKKALELLQDWDQNLCEYTSMIYIIKKITKLKIQNCWNVSMTSIYNEQKAHKKYLFEESLLLHPSDTVCVNALKHDPSLLSRYKSIVDAMCCNDSVSLKHTLRKLRIYWSKSIAQEWINTYILHLKKPIGHKALLEGLCTILPQKEVMFYLRDFIPVNTNIEWGVDFDDVAFKLRKNTAGQLYKIRPPVDMNVVLQFAKDDYLQYVISSLNEMLYNISPVKTTYYATILLESPVSVQKLAIRFITDKLHFDLCKQFITILWSNTKSLIVKRLLFKQLLKLISKKVSSENFNELFKIVNDYIQNMGLSDVVILQDMLERLSELPLNIRSLIFQKIYIQLSLLGCENLKILVNILNIMDLMEPSFIENVLSKYFYKYLDKTCYDHDKLVVCTNILSMYLLTCKSDDVQTKRYKIIFSPIAQRYLVLWRVKVKNEFVFRKSFKELLLTLIANLKIVVLKSFVIPKQLFADIRSFISTKLTLEENYEIVTLWNVAFLFIEVLDHYENVDSGLFLSDSLDVETQTIQNKVWQKLCATIAPCLGGSLVNYFTVFIPSILDLIYSLDTEILWNVLSSLDFSEQNRYLVIKSMLTDVNVPVCYHIAMNVLKRYPCDEECDELRKAIIKIIEKHESSAVKAMRGLIEIMSDSDTDTSDW